MCIESEWRGSVFEYVSFLGSRTRGAANTQCVVARDNANCVSHSLFGDNHSLCHGLCVLGTLTVTSDGVLVPQPTASYRADISGLLTHHQELAGVSRFIFSQPSLIYCGDTLTHIINNKHSPASASVTLPAYYSLTIAL